MKKNSERAKIIRELIHTTDQEFTDEELIHQLTAAPNRKSCRSVSAHRTQSRDSRAAGRSYSALSA